MLKSRKFGLRQQLAREYFRRFKSTPGGTALKDCLDTLEGIAFEKSPTQLHLRMAGDREAVYIDMANEDNQVVELRDGTWRITNSAPYMFRRTDLTAPLVTPVKRGKLSQLWRHINIAPDDRPLLVAMMIDAQIQPQTSKPITAFLAEHGSAKSTTAKRVVDLIDPSTVELRSPPRDLDTWITAASGSWMVALDNLGSIPEWLSNALCRAATGDGNVKRALYTDDDLSVVKFRRSVMITGIDLGGLNGDLADRLVAIELRAIQNRLHEDELELQWQRERGEILGGLLSLAAKVHHKLPTVEIADLPRMADFARVLASIDAIKGTTGIERYRDRGRHMMADSALSNSFIAKLIAWQQNIESKSAAEILQMIVPSMDATGAKPVDWPKTARQVTTLLTKNAPAIRQLGWEITNDDGENKENVLKWTLRQPEVQLA